MAKEKERAKEERVYLSMSVLAVAIILTVIAVVTVTIIAEVYAPLKELLTRLTGHHWITKGLMALAVFALTVLLGGLVVRGESPDPFAWSWIAAAVTLAGVVVLFLFFIGHYVATR
jgi:O-antigen/teichoic acid export membrane protein